MVKIINYKGFKFNITPWIGNEKVLLASSKDIDKQLSSRSIVDLRKQIKNLVKDYIKYEGLKSKFE